MKALGIILEVVVNVIVFGIPYFLGVLLFCGVPFVLYVVVIGFLCRL